MFNIETYDQKFDNPNHMHLLFLSSFAETMKVSSFVCLLATILPGMCDPTNREPLTYAPTPNGTYVLPKNSSVSTLLDFVKSRPDLSKLATVLSGSAGMYLWHYFSVTTNLTH